jgi:transposase InsO family protein
LTGSCRTDNGVDVNGADCQQERRTIESETRQGAVAYAALVVQTGGTKTEAAVDLGVSRRTLRSWSTNPGGIELRGRPRVVLTDAQAAQVHESLDELGPQGGVETLRHLHPVVTRRNLKCLVAGYREAYIKEHGLVTEKLKWPEPGTVWTMDHTELAVPAAGGERYALSVRDLGSGLQLLWEPVQSPDAASTVRLLLDLFFKHGAPLVLKSDNGSAFIAWLTEKLLAWWNVVHLLSPPRRPGYNGVVEVGMQWLKPRTEHAARRAGHGSVLRPEDFAHACKVANEITWPERSGGKVRPIDLWESRRAMTDPLRSAFGERVAAEERELRACLEGVPGKRELVKARRDAIRRALVAYGFLLVRRRPITLRELARKAANKC